MDPFTSLGIASNILQLCDVAWKLSSGTHAVYSSLNGAAPSTLALDAVVESIADLARSITDATRSGVPPRLKNLCGLSAGLATDLTAILIKLKANQPKKKWQSFVVAWREIRTKSQIKEFTDRLQLLQTQVVAELQYLLVKQGSDVLQELQSLGYSTQHLGTAVESDADKLRTSIIDQLSHFNITKLEATTEGILERFENLTIHQSTNPDTILSKLDALSMSISRLGQDMEATKARLETLETIRFDRLPHRYEQLSQAHQKTFEWAFEDRISVPGTSEAIPLHFKDWLRNGEGNLPFWIRGKAGSGKSTLMKFICTDERTTHHLQFWAGTGHKLVIAKYFFWNPGASLQKSREGLLRTLLFDILRQCPEYLTVLERKFSGHLEEVRRGNINWTWSLLTETFQEVIQKAATTTKMCIFIDGLDEHDGDSDSLITTVKELSSHANTKVCVSSRPWAEFILEFGEQGSWNMLKVEDLTAEDIHAYAHAKLMANNRFARLAEKDDSIQQLIGEIVQKSQGVFLWVYLVVRSLLEGLRYADSIQLLRKRLDGFPSDLDDFFYHMLSGVPEIYRAKAVSTFKVAMAVTEPLSAMTYYFIDKVAEDQMFALDRDWERISVQEAHDCLLDTTLRLDGWTKGLLEVVHDKNKNERDYYHSTVHFLHRTAKDFIKESERVRKMFKKYSTPAENAQYLVCHGSLAALKACSTSRNEADLNPKYCHQIFLYASLISDDLWELYRVGSILEQLGKPNEDGILIGFAARHGLKEYILRTAHHTTGMLYKSSNFYTEMLRTALSTYGEPFDITFAERISRIWDRKRELVVFLLEHGADPNCPEDSDERSTIWLAFLSRFWRPIKAERSQIVEICRAMILAGADLDKIPPAGSFLERFKPGTERISEDGKSTD